jgi:hypothetical protein
MHVKYRGYTHSNNFHKPKCDAVSGMKQTVCFQPPDNLQLWCAKDSLFADRALSERGARGAFESREYKVAHLHKFRLLDARRLGSSRQQRYFDPAQLPYPNLVLVVLVLVAFSKKTCNSVIAIAAKSDVPRPGEFVEAST